MEYGEKIHNAGFVKIQMYGEKCEIYISVNKLFSTDNFTKKICLAGDGKTIVLGNINIQNGKGCFTCKEIATENFGENISYYNLNRIYITLSESRELACNWAESSQNETLKIESGINFIPNHQVEMQEDRNQEDKFKENNQQKDRQQKNGSQEDELKENQQKDRQQKNENQEDELQENKQQMDRQPENWNQEDKSQGDKLLEKKQQGNQKLVEVEYEHADLEAAEYRNAENFSEYCKNTDIETNDSNVKFESEFMKMQNQMQKNMLYDDKWQQLEHIYPHTKPFRDKREYLVIRPSDFVILSNKYYHLVNNSFLLHGYYNYEHLILCKITRKENELYYVGVPGNLYEKEKKVALMFGFQSFECKKEPACVGDFGYYMINVEI